MTLDDTYERALEPWEIEERKNKALELMEEQDGLGSTVEQHKRQIRTLKLRQSTVESRIRLLRHEVRSGKTLVDRQAELPYADTLVERPKDSLIARDVLAGVYGGIDGMSDEPDADTDPPEHDKPELTDSDDLLGKLYPMARTMPDLWTELVGWTLTTEQADILISKQLPVAGTPGFDAVAQWSRLSKAHKIGQERAQAGKGGIHGLYIPAVPPMPKEIAALLKPEKKKRGTRPFSSPSADLPVNPPAKKTRKRRSGSTANSD